MKYQSSGYSRRDLLKILVTLGLIPANASWSPKIRAEETKSHLDLLIEYNQLIVAPNAWFPSPPLIPNTEDPARNEPEYLLLQPNWYTQLTKDDLRKIISELDSRHTKLLNYDSNFLNIVEGKLRYGVIMDGKKVQSHISSQLADANWNHTLALLGLVLVSLTAVFGIRYASKSIPAAVGITLFSGTVGVILQALSRPSHSSQLLLNYSADRIGLVATASKSPAWAWARRIASVFGLVSALWSVKVTYDKKIQEAHEADNYARKNQLVNERNNRLLAKYNEQYDLLNNLIAEAEPLIENQASLQEQLVSGNRETKASVEALLLQDPVQPSVPSPPLPPTAPYNLGIVLDM